MDEGCTSHGRAAAARVGTLPARRTEVMRKFVETKMSARVYPDDGLPGLAEIGSRFFDHMLTQLACHGAFSLELSCQGDLTVYEHHTVEDPPLAPGQALREALRSRCRSLWLSATEGISSL